MKHVQYQKYQNHETRVPMNSGNDPKVMYDPIEIRTWKYALDKSFREY